MATNGVSYALSSGHKDVSSLSFTPRCIRDLRVKLTVTN